MASLTDKYILSEHRQLRMIKRAQWLLQLPFVLLLLLAFLLNYIFRGYNLYTAAFVTALVAVTGFLLVGACFRFRQRLPIPPPNCVASPLQGKVKYIRGNEDITVLNIRRILLDSVEIRSPHPDCRLEDGLLKMPVPDGTITFRFNARHIRWMDDPDFTRGNIIGMIVGTSSCTVSIPKGMDVMVKAQDTVDTGDPLVPLEDRVPEQRDILVPETEAADA